MGPNFACLCAIVLNKTNGNNLNEFLSKSNSVLLNRKDEFTYLREFNGYKEVLDLVIISLMLKNASLIMMLSSIATIYLFK